MNDSDRSAGLRVIETPDRYGPNTEQIVRLLSSARGLSRDDLMRLDSVENHHASTLLAAWEHLRDRLRSEPWQTWRFNVRGDAWQAIQVAGRHAGIRVPRDTGYWRVDTSIGCGAARAARFAASALVAPDRLDAEYLDVLVKPWRDVVGDPLPQT